MDFYKVPIGFGMALAVNEPAMNAYAAMTEEQKQAIINKARNICSEKRNAQFGDKPCKRKYVLTPRVADCCPGFCIQGECDMKKILKIWKKYLYFLGFVLI